MTSSPGPLAAARRVGHAFAMAGQPQEPTSPTLTAPFGDLDLDVTADEEEWDRRVMALAAGRITAERARLERLGIVDATGELVSRELPPNMRPKPDWG